MNNFFWMGIVENSDDPLKLGRCQVRIQGVHSDNKNLVPTADLPWAMSQNTSNSSRLYSTYNPGDFVFGMFPSGMSTQSPIITGSLPGFAVKATDTVSEFLTKKDMPDGLPAKDSVGTPTFGALARGDIANTKIAITNSTLTHSCDFKFMVGAKLDLGLPINPVTAIQDAIRKGKNKAAMAMSIIMRQISAALRKLINAALAAIGLDKTGELSKLFSFSKDLFRQINLFIQQAAEIVEMASFYYNFVKDIKQIVDYLKSLPAYLKSVVLGCITQFMASIQNFVNMVKTIPGMVNDNIDAMLAQLQSDSQSTIDNLNNQSANNANTSSNTTSDIITMVTVYQPDEQHANTLLKFVTDSFQNANVTIVNATSNTFSKSLMQTP